MSIYIYIYIYFYAILSPLSIQSTPFSMICRREAVEYTAPNLALVFELYRLAFAAVASYPRQLSHFCVHVKLTANDLECAVIWTRDLKRRNYKWVGLLAESWTRKIVTKRSMKQRNMFMLSNFLSLTFVFTLHIILFTLFCLWLFNTFYVFLRSFSGNKEMILL